MHLARRHRTALAVAALGAGVGLAPLQSASADPATPAIAVGMNQRIDMWGPAGDMDLTVTAPPTADAYIRLELEGYKADNLTFTDEAGNTLPLVHDDRNEYVLIGADDSDHNGVKGAPLAEGVVHLHVSAGYPAYSNIQTRAYLIDGATGTVVAHSTPNTEAPLFVDQPYLSTSWQNAQGSTVYDSAVTVATGDTHPVDERLSLQMLMRTVPNSTRTRLVFTAQQISAAGYTASQLADAVRIGYSADDDQFTRSTWTLGPDGSLMIELPALSGWQPWAQKYQYLHFDAAWGLPAGTLTGTLEVRDSEGKQYAGLREDLKFAADVVPAFARAAFYGRDSAGVLWQYQASPTPQYTHYTTRAKVGGGWQIYNAVTKLSALKADGTGDLVARDSSGILWYYQGTGNIRSPFAPRTRVGAGWQTYTTLVGAGDLTGDGHPDLLARDHDGILWLYQGTGNPAAPFTARTRIGAGWNAYTTLIGGTDLTGDGHPDLLARDHDGILWLYQGTGNPTAPFTARTRIGAGWNAYTALVGTYDMTGDGKPDLLTVDHDGTLWLYGGTGNPTAPFASRAKIGTGWSIYGNLI
ncbi:VCBS repeat-containing protein [Streptomyces sp. Li-HN-5-11]|uniref:FG-GAP repeat domain-containing protein n=1 Tax=Streptomyces sp. Li-HN-5-11 TaxID=3075432 RepID=UPI0028B111FE|nr:VCBS repeat-containing protein [Streptomyces sp. Li-HN-5-11]WNM35445.1 VCBS repeat-containing protein [Streptomyces sp. Li-HN-5-11]